MPKRELETVFEHYLKALEEQNPTLMASVWSGQKSDQFFSMEGLFMGENIWKEYTAQILPERMRAIHIPRWTWHALDLQEDTALAQVQYEVLLGPAEESALLHKTVLETQMYRKQASGEWKLAYVHQSWMPQPSFVAGQNVLENTLDGMLEWLAEKNDTNLAIPRSVKDKKEAILAQMENLTADPDARWLELHKTYLEESRRLKKMEDQPLLMPSDQICMVWQGDPASLAADGIISFMDQKTPVDKDLALEAGLELQADLQAIEQLKPREVLVLSGYHLPVKHLAEIRTRPVYGLFTRQKAEHFQSLLEQAIQTAAQKGCKTLAISGSWHEALHVPLWYARTLIETVLQKLEAQAILPQADETTPLIAKRTPERNVQPESAQKEEFAQAAKNAILDAEADMDEVNTDRGDMDEVNMGEADQIVEMAIQSEKAFESQEEADVHKKAAEERKEEVAKQEKRFEKDLEIRLEEMQEEEIQAEEPAKVPLLAQVLHAVAPGFRRSQKEGSPSNLEESSVVTAQTVENISSLGIERIVFVAQSSAQRKALENSLEQIRKGVPEKSSEEAAA